MPGDTFACIRASLRHRGRTRELLNIFRHGAVIRNATSASNSLVCHSRYIASGEREIGCWNAHDRDASFTSALECFWNL